MYRVQSLELRVKAVVGKWYFAAYLETESE